MATVMVRNTVMGMVNIMVMDTAVVMVLRWKIRKKDEYLSNSRFIIFFNCNQII